jgi:hypothetical protein
LCLITFYLALGCTPCSRDLVELISDHAAVMRSHLRRRVHLTHEALTVETVDHELVVDDANRLDGVRMEADPSEDQLDLALTGQDRAR